MLRQNMAGNQEMGGNAEGACDENRDYSHNAGGRRMCRPTWPDKSKRDCACIEFGGDCARR
jgi:hypothetical protein